MMLGGRLAVATDAPPLRPSTSNGCPGPAAKSRAVRLEVLKVLIADNPLRLAASRPVPTPKPLGDGTIGPLLRPPVKPSPRGASFSPGITGTGKAAGRSAPYPPPPPPPGPPCFESSPVGALALSVAPALMLTRPLLRRMKGR